MSRLQDKYNQEIAPALMSKFGYKSVMQIPKLTKITVNIGLGEAKENTKVIDAAVADLAAITGQKPIVTHARKSVANFKLREGMAIGCKVTLRRDKMYEFMERFICIACPRIRDFQGFNASFDGKGNFAFGIKEQIVFPEINYEKVEDVRGLDIVICTTAKTDEEAKFLLTSFNLPYKK